VQDEAGISKVSKAYFRVRLNTEKVAEMMNHRMCVAMFIHQYYPRFGGAEQQLANLSPALQARGVEVHVLTRRFPGLAPFERINGVPVHRLPIPGPKPTASMSFTLTALGLLRKLRPNVVHAHTLFSPTTTALLAKQLLDVPVVVTVHGGGKTGEVVRLQNKALGAARLKLFSQHVDAFVTISQEIKGVLVDSGVPEEHCVFIPNAVDVERFIPLSPAQKRAQRAALDLPDVPIAIYTGRLAPEKCLDRLVTLWADVRAMHPQALLLLVGAGPEEEALRKVAGDGVCFVGRVDDVLSYLQAADLFVLSSRAEGLSVALLEAMACGLPAVITEVGGAADVIRHGTHGWLAPVDDTSALRNALISLFGHDQMRIAFGKQARARVVQEFALPVAADRLRALYDRLCTV
jgi:glycosyltransferase involved in cell wall biosynthesis